MPPLTVGALLDEMQRFLDVRKWTVKELFRNRSVNLSNRAAGDFALSAAELCAFLSSPEVGLRLSPSDARALIADIDTSGNGELEASELDKALRARKPANSQARKPASTQARKPTSTQANRRADTQAQMQTRARAQAKRVRLRTSHPMNMANSSIMKRTLCLIVLCSTRRSSCV